MVWLVVGGEVRDVIAVAVAVAAAAAAIRAIGFVIVVGSFFLQQQAQSDQGRPLPPQRFLMPELRLEHMYLAFNETLLGDNEREMTPIHQRAQCGHHLFVERKDSAFDVLFPVERGDVINQQHRYVRRCGLPLFVVNSTRQT